MRKTISDSILETVKDLHACDAVDEITMKNFEALCVPDVPQFTPAKIITLRKKNHLSQAAMATLFNVSPSTVQKWERGAKHPAGASCKLLDLVERKGIEVLA